MTGFGRGSASGQRHRVTVELRSVNGRFLEVRSRLPRSLVFLEPELKELLEGSLRRGVVELVVTVHSQGSELAAHFDERQAKGYARMTEKLAEDLGLSSGLTALALLKLPGVMAAEPVEDLEKDGEIGKLARKALQEALELLLDMRRQEGEKLGKFLQRELAEVKSHQEWIHKHREELNQRYSRKIQARLKEFLGGAEQGGARLDEGRLYQEVAFYLERGDVTEELDRLASHLKQCEDALSLEAGKSLGKRLEFLAQELGREVNTIGAKSDQAQVTSHVVEMKLTLEKIREQVQNLE
jgi:uncharacterized protein (TIGR00255 family)